MSEFEYWRLCEQLNIVQAALLIAGYDPEEHEESVEKYVLTEQPPGYHACKSAIIGALRRKSIDGYLHFEVCRDLSDASQERLNLFESFVVVENLKTWLIWNGVSNGFFFPEDERPRGYLDPEDERYAPKLAAAVRAWLAADEDKSLKGTPKKRVEKWLRLHASEYGLTQKDGKPNESAIQAIARIANWKPEGGAPVTQLASDAKPTDGKNTGAKVIKLKQVASAKPSLADDSDDEIPF